MKNLVKKIQCHPFLIIIIALLFSYPVNSFSQDQASQDKDLADSVAINMVNDFVIAVNTGEREAM